MQKTCHGHGIRGGDDSVLAEIQYIFPSSPGPFYSRLLGELVHMLWCGRKTSALPPPQFDLSIQLT